MYKVFVNEKVIYFTNNASKFNGSANVLVLNFFHASIVPFLMDVLLKDAHLETIVLNVSNVEEAFTLFQKEFKLIDAAGGIVSNANEELLLIHRLGKWDLPKGKIEEGENKENAAIREVEEECGVNNLNIAKQAPTTYHIYPWKDQWVLKSTFWFTMTTNYNGKLIPQTEEGIEVVKWVPENEVGKVVAGNTYASIEGLLKNMQYL